MLETAKRILQPSKAEEGKVKRRSLANLVVSPSKLFAKVEEEAKLALC